MQSSSVFKQKLIFFLKIKAFVDKKSSIYRENLRNLIHKFINFINRAILFKFKILEKILTNILALNIVFSIKIEYFDMVKIF